MRRSRDASESKSERDPCDGSGDKAQSDKDEDDDPHSLSLGNADAEADDATDDDDSDTETQRIGTSVLRFARRCVQTGEFAKAMAALQNVVEISSVDAVPCRQALLFAAQICTVTSQEAKALTCLMELWDKMPPPYTSQDAQLLLTVLYEQLAQPRFAVFWFKKAFPTFPPSPAAAFTAWLSLADKSFDESDFIVSTEAYARAFGSVVATQRWPAELNVFRFIARFLTALTSVAWLRRDRQSHCQQIAFSLALVLVDSDAVHASSLAQRAFDDEYLRLRRVYARSFSSIYDYLFRGEDRFVGRIARAWRVARARRERQRASAERERQRHEDAVAAAANAKGTKTHTTKKSRKKPHGPASNGRLERDDNSDEQQRLQQLRERTKARIAALQAATDKKTKDRQSSAKSPLKPTETVTSPTRRKLEAVKRLRRLPTEEEPTSHDASEPAAAAPSSRSNQRPGSATDASVKAASLLDVYSFPPLASHRRAFEVAAGRAQHAVDLDDDALVDIEAFARMAHYRSRVLVQQHQPLHDAGRIDLARATPQWLRRFHDVLRFIDTHETQLARRPTPKSYFSDIHARVVAQLAEIHTTYMLQHGKTTFTRQLATTLRRLERWQFTSVTHELLPALASVQAVGEQEEAHRNLEFFHGLQQAHT